MRRVWLCLFPASGPGISHTRRRFLKKYPLCLGLFPRQDAENEGKWLSPRSFPEADAGELGKVINNVKQRAKKLNNVLVESGSISQIAEGVSSAVSQLTGMIGELTAAYNTQLEAETKRGTWSV